MLSIGELRTNVCGSGVFMGRGRVEVECTNLHAPHSHPSYVIYLSARSRLGRKAEESPERVQFSEVRSTIVGSC